MATQNEGPELHLPNAGDLAGFLDGQNEGSVETPDTTDASDGLLKDVRVDDEGYVEQEEELPAGDTFDRKYVEKLRRESAAYRERAKKYESVFEGYEEGAVDEWRDMITNFKQDPKAVAEQWKDLSDKIIQQFSPAEQEQITEALNDEEQPLTMSQLQTILDQRQQDQQLDSMVADIESEARELGYNLKSREYKILLMTAQELPSGDIKEAHALIQSEYQREFDRRIAELEKQGGGYRPPVAKNGAPSNERAIKDFSDAKAALTNFLDANK